MSDENLLGMMCPSDNEDIFTNITTFDFGPRLEKSSEEIFYEKANYWCSNVLLPLIFLFGFIGNILNIVTFRYVYVNIYHVKQFIE